MKKRIIYLPLILFSLAVAIIFASYIPSLINYKFSASYGDYPIYINPRLESTTNIFSYNSLFSGGVSQPFKLALIFPQYTFYVVMNIFGLSPAMTTVLYYCLMIFLGLFSSYYYLNSISNENDAIKIALSMLYVFTPYFITYQKPGHISLLMLFYIFPLLLTGVIEFIRTPKIKLLIFLFAIGTTLSSSFSNIAYLLIAIGALSLLCLPEIVNRRKFLHYLLTLIVLIASNSYWIFPSLQYYRNSYNSELTYSQKNLGATINVATEKSLISNIVFGQVDIEQNTTNFPTKTLISVLIASVYGVLLLSVLHTLTTKGKLNSRLLIQCSALIGVIYLLKAYNPPLNELFSVLYRNIPLMQIFRRPQSKIYWLYFFILTTLAFISLRPKNKNKLYKYIYFGGAALFIAITVTLQSLVFFNIPNEYVLAKKHLSNQNVKKILLLPSLSYKPVFYKKKLNNIGGIDFLNSYLEYPILTNDFFSENSMPNKLKIKVEGIIKLFDAKIIDDGLLCDNLAQLDISHVILRNNVNHINTSTLKSKLIKSASFNLKLNNSEITIFDVVSQCQRKNASSVFAKFDLPGIKLFPLNKLRQDVIVELHENYDENWEFYTIGLTPNKLSYSVSKNKILHSILNGYANSWVIDISNINNPKLLVMIHGSQIASLIGLIITVSTLLILVFFEAKSIKINYEKQ